MRGAYAAAAAAVAAAAVAAAARGRRGSQKAAYVLALKTLFGQFDSVIQSHAQLSG